MECEDLGVLGSSFSRGGWDTNIGLDDCRFALGNDEVMIS